jgi:FtsZ-binding cell division protein ZapB
LEAADTIERLEGGIANCSKFADELMTANKELSARVQERDRLLTLATKHCPREHHDWQEILRIAGDA